jgi:ribosomal protein S18 acetylase RimI-like enzyme
MRKRFGPSAWKAWNGTRPPSSFNDESARPLAWFADGLDNGFVLGAVRSTVSLRSPMEGKDGLVGVAGLHVGGEKSRHRGVLWGMYVRERARGTGIAGRLVEGILTHARQHLEEVVLSVEANNASAVACYKSAGFSVTGQDARALKIGGEYFDLLLMKMRFVAD